MFLRTFSRGGLL